MKTTIRILALVALGIGFMAVEDIFHASTYVPFAIDAYHTSRTAAFMLAAASGGLLYKWFW